MACRSGERALDAIDASVDLQVAIGILQRHAYRQTVGHMYVHRCAFDGLEEQADGLVLPVVGSHLDLSNTLRPDRLPFAEPPLGSRIAAVGRQGL